MRDGAGVGSSSPRRALASAGRFPPFGVRVFGACTILWGVRTAFVGPRGGRGVHAVSLPVCDAACLGVCVCGRRLLASPCGGARAGPVPAAWTNCWGPSRQATCVWWCARLPCASALTGEHPVVVMVQRWRAEEQRSSGGGWRKHASRRKNLKAAHVPASCHERAAAVKRVKPGREGHAPPWQGLAGNTLCSSTTLQHTRLLSTRALPRRRVRHNDDERSNG